VASLLDAAGRRSLGSLDQARVALPGYRSEVEAELRELTTPPPPPDEKIHEWRAVTLQGRRFRTEDEVDRAIEAIADELKAPIRDGFTVVVR